MENNILHIVENPQIIKGVFGIEVLHLNEIEVFELRIEYGFKPTAYFRFRLECFPKNPPIKWIEKGYNSAIMSLCLSEISKVEVIDFQDFRKGDIVLNHIEGGCIMKFIGESCEFSICCEFIFIESITGVQTENDEI